MVRGFLKVRKKGVAPQEKGITHEATYRWGEPALCFIHIAVSVLDSGMSVLHLKILSGTPNISFVR